MITHDNRNIYKMAQHFAEVTKAFLIRGNVRKAKQCMQIAERFFTHGSKEIQYAIANVYVYSISKFMEVHHCNIKALFPQKLQKEYYKQINTSGL